MQWVCRCNDNGQCKDEHKALCAQRQAAKAIARLVTMQHEVALAIREALTIMIVQERVNRPPVDGTPCLAITYKLASRSAEEEAPFTLSLPQEVRVQTCCVENCVGAIVDTTAIMAWLAEGTSAIAIIQNHLANEIRISS